MKTIALLLLGSLALAGASWESLQKLNAGDSIELTASGEKPRTVTYRSSSADSLIIATASSELSIARADVERVRMKQPGRRTRLGVLSTAIGAAAGAGIGLAVCPGCSGEGVGGKYIGPGVAAGAGIGALGFLSSDYRIVYQKR